MHKLEENINHLMLRLLEDYDGGKTIDEIKTFDHPDKEVITEIIASLRRIIFPGYFRNKSYRVYTVRNNISMLLEDVIFKLIKQISIVLRYDKDLENADEFTLAGIAEGKTFEFLEKLPKIREYIETDVQAAYDGDPAADRHSKARSVTPLSRTTSLSIREHQFSAAIPLSAKTSLSAVMRSSHAPFQRAQRSA